MDFLSHMHFGRFLDLLNDFLLDGFRFLLWWGHVLLLSLGSLHLSHSLLNREFTLLLLEPQVLYLLVPVVGLLSQAFNCNVLHLGLLLKHLELFVNGAGFLLHAHVHATFAFVLLELVSEALELLSADLFSVEFELESVEVLSQVVDLLKQLHVLLSDQLVGLLLFLLIL
jgi:hypothetical protein